MIIEPKLRKKELTSPVTFFQKWSKILKKDWTNPFPYLKYKPKFRKIEFTNNLQFLKSDLKFWKKIKLTPLHFSFHFWKLNQNWGKKNGLTPLQFFKNDPKKMIFPLFGKLAKFEKKEWTNPFLILKIKPKLRRKNGKTLYNFSKMIQKNFSFNWKISKIWEKRMD